MKMRILILLLLGLTTGTSFGAQTHTTQEKRQFAQDLKSLVEQSLNDFGFIPGLAVSVVDKDQLLLAQGYGWLDREKRVKSSADGDYYIASATKSFTALAALMLQKQGLLDLDRSLQSYYPKTAFDPALHADKITLRDLLTHTSGLANDPIANRLAYTGVHTPTLLRKLLADSKPSGRSKLGEFQYTNTGYNIVALVMEDVTGKPWQDLVAELIFKPLGMQHTSNRVSTLGDNIARPYNGSLPAPYRITLEKQDNTMHSAGGTFSSANDIAKWLQIQLGLGRVDGRQIFDKALIEQSRQPLARVGKKFGSYYRQYYALGWYLADFGPYAMVQHFGSFAGQRSHVSFLPKQGLGVAVFINEDTAGFYLADLLADFTYHWWLAEDRQAVVADYQSKLAKLKQNAEGYLNKVAKARKQRQQRPWQLTLKAEHYVGQYDNPQFGTIEVTLAQGKPAFRFGNLYAVSEPYNKPQSVRVELDPGSGEVIEFVTDNGQVTGLKYTGAIFVRMTR